MNTTKLRALALDVAHLVPVLFAGLFLTSDGGLLRPWYAATVDLLIYRSAGVALLHGTPIYGPAATTTYPFIYPPFAAVASILLAVLPVVIMQQGWALLNSVLTLAMVRRAGYRGWPASLITVAALVLAKPFVFTLGYGQVNILITALVVLDLCPGPRWLPGRRLLPEGVLTGIAAGIKLTPLIFIVLLAVSGRRRAALAATGSFLATVVLGLVVRPGDSVTYWSGLLHGNTGINVGLPFAQNQSLVAAYNRFAGHYLAHIPVWMLPLLAVIVVLSVGAGVVWYRRGEPMLAVAICGVGSVLASPIGWNHHLVWILPLALALVASREGSASVRYLGLLLVVWIAWAPYSVFPNDAGREFAWSSIQKLIGAGTLLLGCAFLIAGIVVPILNRPRGETGGHGWGRSQY